MTKYTLAHEMDDLIISLNVIRKEQGKVVVQRCWTGAGHWLKTIETDYRSLGGIFTNDREFIGFLRGLLFVE